MPYQAGYAPVGVEAPLPIRPAMERERTKYDEDGTQDLVGRLRKVVRADQAGVKGQLPFAGPSFLDLECDVALRTH